MTGSAPLYLALEGRAVPFHVRRETTGTSLHTGRPLAEVHGWVTTTDVELSRWLTATLRELGDEPVRAEDAGGEFAGTWRLSWNSYGEKAGVHTYTLILREREELALEALVVAGVELHPYEYREELVGEALAICAKMVGPSEDVVRLRELLRGDEAFDVVRHGIQEEPRRMRLGVGEWAEYEDRVKYRLTLVEEGLRPSDHPRLALLERENHLAALGYYIDFTERLAQMLVERGVLPAAEVAAARAAAAERPEPVRHDLWRVATDIDET